MPYLPVNLSRSIEVYVELKLNKPCGHLPCLFCSFCSVLNSIKQSNRPIKSSYTRISSDQIILLCRSARSHLTFQLKQSLIESISFYELNYVLRWWYSLVVGSELEQIVFGKVLVTNVVTGLLSRSVVHMSLHLIWRLILEKIEFLSRTKLKALTVVRFI